jgi:hypothetical protein
VCVFAGAYITREKESLSYLDYAEGKR